jgi:hypothetical protein
MNYKKMAVVCMLFLAGPAMAAGGDGRDWTMLMGGPQHAGRIGSGGGVDFSKLALVGRYALHAEISASRAAAGPASDPWDLYLSSPLVEGGKVYAGSSDGHVYALDAATGAERWRFRTRTEGQADYMQGIQASPSVDGDTVYIGARDAYLYAIDAVFTEAPHTVYSAVEHIKRLGAFSASPLWHRGQLILATATGELLFFEAGRADAQAWSSSAIRCCAAAGARSLAPLMK